MTDKELAFYNCITDMAAKIDSKPKNLLLLQDKGREYESMCLQLAQGYELDYISFPYIIVNEFGKGEHIDNFNRRHPKFAEDIENYRKKYLYGNRD